jgi:hypothetical protein
VELLSVAVVFIVAEELCEYAVCSSFNPPRDTYKELTIIANIRYVAKFLIVQQSNTYYLYS